MKKIKITLAICYLIGLTTSCTDFLSETPDNRTQLDSADKISELLVNAYPTASYIELAETMTDNVSDTEYTAGFSIRNTQNYNWEMIETTDDDSPAFYWDACYNAIAHANQALDAIEKLGFPAKLNPQRGEALMARAYSHFMLVSIFSKRYNPATASTDLGVPYITKPELVLSGSYTRNSVKEVFANIENDLQEGLKYVTDNYEQPKFHFTIAASKAFASRFYVVKGNWDKVLEFTSDLALNPNGQLRDYNAYDLLSTEAQFEIYSKSSENTNLLISTTESTYNRTIGRNRYALSVNDMNRVYGNATNLFNRAWNYNTYTRNGGIAIILAKFSEYFKFTNTSAGIGNAYVNNVLLSNEEVYLNYIEALVMTNNFDQANQAIQYFYSIRLTGYNATTDIVTQAKIVTKYPVIVDEFTPFYSLTPLQTSYIKAVAELRRIDFIHEGLRWFDIKRFALSVTHKTVNKPDNVLLKDDNRKAVQIPLHVSNTGVEKNPI